MAISKVENKKEEINKTSSPESQGENKDKKIKLDPNEKVDDDEPLQAEFEDEAAANAFASQPTKENKIEEVDPHMSAEEVQRQTLEFENSRSGKLEYKDLKQTAEFIITLMDTALSTAFKLFARDTSSSAYSMPAPNKKILIEQLTLILSKYQSKFKIEFLFFMGLIVLYAPMGIASFKNRKLTSPKKKVIETKEVKEEKRKESVTEASRSAEVETQNRIVNLQSQEEKQPKEGKVFVPGPKKRNKGMQPKVAN